MKINNIKNFSTVTEFITIRKCLSHTVVVVAQAGFADLIFFLLLLYLFIKQIISQKEKVLQRLNKHHNQQALTSSIEEGLKLQAINRAQRVVCHFVVKYFKCTR